MRTLKSFLDFLTVWSLVISSMAAAQDSVTIDVLALGPQLGEPAPDFNLPDQRGQYQSLDSLMGTNGIILLFHRSADW